MCYVVFRSTDELITQISPSLISLLSDVQNKPITELWKSSTFN